MEMTGIAHRPLLQLPSDAAAQRFLIKSHLGIPDLRVSERRGRCFGRLTTGFSDSGHQQYYVSSRSSTKKKENEKSSEIKVVKHKLKLIKRLSTDLSSMSVLANGKETGNCLTDEAKISDAVELLQALLQRLKLEQKDFKRKLKEEKARTKSAFKQSKCKSDSESSSSSSESSDSECGGEVIDMSRLRSKDLKSSEHNDAQKALQLSASAGPSNRSEDAVLNEVLSFQNPRESCCGSSNDGTSTKRIEICMGGKCKKSGGEALLEKFQSKVGAEGTVVGCKCMGKCKDGPNVRVSDSACEVEATRTRRPGRPSMNSMCIAVGLGDVDAILSNIFHKDGNQEYFVAPS